MALVTPIDQTAFGPAHGNCLNACLASLLDLALEEVPEFKLARFDDAGRSWRLQTEDWLQGRGLGLLSIERPADGPVNGVTIPSGIHYLAWGPSPRGLLHSVIYRNGALVHDPHPDRQGLVGIDELAFLVRLT